MRVFVMERSYRVPTSARPHAVLYRDKWDDFRVKTMFRLEVFLPGGDVIDAGNVKITSFGLESGFVELPDDEFELLPEKYCSLGQEYTYYEALAGAGWTIFEDVLSSLRDVILQPALQEVFAGDRSYRESLLRFDSASRAIQDVPAVIAELRGGTRSPTTQRLTFVFNTNVGGDGFKVEFRFADRERIPSRINAIIGYNGTGKTQLLANLAVVAAADFQKRSQSWLRRDHGYLEPSDLSFGAVVAISYSAFDIFKTPDVSDNSWYTYTYCGLRREEGSGEAGLKSADEITDDFFGALILAKSGRQKEILQKVFARLKQEPSFARVGLSEYFDGDLSREEVQVQFGALSTGHKIVLNIATQLVANLQQRSLILLDEPESHLHPPLLAALLRALNEALEQRDSFAVMATHSPVVLQEVPGRYVYVLRRDGYQTLVEAPETETFGENVSFLTRTIFSLDSSATDHHSVLQELADLDLESVEQLFDSRLGNQARTYFQKLRRDWER